MKGWSDDLARGEVLAAPRGAHLLPPDGRIVARPGWYQVLAPSVRDAALNEVVQAVVRPDAVEETVDEVLADYRTRGSPCKWVVGPDSAPQDRLIAALEARGLRSWEAWGLVRAPGAAAATVEVEEVTAAGAAAYAGLMAAGWGLPGDYLEAAVRRALQASPRRHAFFLIRRAGRPVAGAGLVVHPRSAYLTGGLVLPEHRGRGLYRTLTAARLAHARARGLTLATTWARAHTAGPILARGGWRRLAACRVFAAEG